MAPPQQSGFDVNAAVSYNTKSYPYFKEYESDIKRVLNTTATWTSPEFATAVYNWQKGNGFAGRLVDGKFGPLTMAKVAKTDATLAGTYDAYKPWKQKHADDRPNQRVVGLIPEVERIRNELGAEAVPMPMLLGWIQVESNGNLHSRGLESLDERGLFQISRDESQAIGVNHDRVGTDQDESIRAGIKAALYHAQNIDGVLAKHPGAERIFPKNSDMYWRLVFFGFSAGDATAERLVANLVASGEQFKDWNDVMKFVAANPGGYKHSPIKWSYHTSRAFNLGNQMVGRQPVANKIEHRIKTAKRKARLVVLDVK